MLKRKKTRGEHSNDDGDHKTPHYTSERSCPKCMQRHVGTKCPYCERAAEVVERRKLRTPEEEAVIDEAVTLYASPDRSKLILDMDISHQKRSTGSWT